MQKTTGPETALTASFGPSIDERVAALRDDPDYQREVAELEASEAAIRAAPAQVLRGVLAEHCFCDWRGYSQVCLCEAKRRDQQFPWAAYVEHVVSAFAAALAAAGAEAGSE